MAKSPEQNPEKDEKLENDEKSKRTKNQKKTKNRKKKGFEEKTNSGYLKTFDRNFRDPASPALPEVKQDTAEQDRFIRATYFSLTRQDALQCDLTLDETGP